MSVTHTYLIGSKAIVHFDDVNVSDVGVALLEALPRRLLTHGVATEPQEGLADRVRKISHHVLGHNLHRLALK